MLTRPNVIEPLHMERGPPAPRPVEPLFGFLAVADAMMTPHRSSNLSSLTLIGLEIRGPVIPKMR
jgi:hypothetical protein